jgi:hypothetical protein
VYLSPRTTNVVDRRTETLDIQPLRFSIHIARCMLWNPILNPMTHKAQLGPSACWEREASGDDMPAPNPSRNKPYGGCSGSASQAGWRVRASRRSAQVCGECKLSKTHAGSALPCHSWCHRIVSRNSVSVGERADRARTVRGVTAATGARTGLNAVDSGCNHQHSGACMCNGCGGRIARRKGEEVRRAGMMAGSKDLKNG